MPIRTSLLVAALLIAKTLTAQRDLEYVTDITAACHTVTLNNRILISGNGNPYIEAFHSEHGMSRYLFPFVDGDRLTYLSRMQPAVYNSRAYYVLWKGADRYLYQFNGNIFTRLTIPGTIVSNPVVFGDNLYFLLQTGSTIQLHLYNGATVSAVTSGTIPATNSDKNG